MSAASNDTDLITFSPDGRLFQIEYAGKAVEKDSLSLGVKCKDGIVLASEKIISSALLVKGGNPKIFWISDTVACATVGHRPDCLYLVQVARNYIIDYKDRFGVSPDIENLISYMALSCANNHLVQYYRPYGCTLIFASYTERKIYALEPNGKSFGYHAACFGKNSNIARAKLQDKKWDDKTCEEAARMVKDIISELEETKSQTKTEIEIYCLSEKNNGKLTKVNI